MRMLTRVCAFLLVALGAGSAGALPVSGPGVSTGGACPQGGVCAPVDYDFAVVPTAASGDIDFSFNGGTSWTVDIVGLTVATLTLEDTGGAIDGVDRIVFSNLVFDVSGWSAVEFLDQISGLATSGTVSGSYEQFLGNVSVGGPTAFGPTPIGAGSLTCDSTLTGQCGFTFGFDAPEFVQNVGTTAGGLPYEFVTTFNVVVPEPASAALLALGLVGLAAARRRG